MKIRIAIAITLALSVNMANEAFAFSSEKKLPIDSVDELASSPTTRSTKEITSQISEQLENLTFAGCCSFAGGTPVWNSEGVNCNVGFIESGVNAKFEACLKNMKIGLKDGVYQKIDEPLQSTSEE